MEAIEIQGTALQIKEYKGHRVVTFKDIDAVHQRPEGTASRNFRNNRKHFVSGVDFYKITPDEFRRAIGGMDLRQQNDVTLITESGYLMLVKSFTDDLAWKVQRELVDTYFRARAEPQQETVTVTVTEANPDIYLEAARILSNVPDCKREIINCLRHVVPDIDDREAVTEVKTEVKKKSRSEYFRQGVDMDIEKLKLQMNVRHYSRNQLAEDVGVTVQTVNNWLAGNSKPLLENRTNVCVALGVDENFLTPLRTRRARN